MAGSTSLRICSFLLLLTMSDAFLFGPSKVSGDGTTNGYSSPKFTLLKKTQSYELRQYEANHWVATSAEGSTNSMFMRLFRYIGGDNDANRKIPMTVPVSTKVTPRKGTSNLYTMQFFLTTSDNPKPNNPDVFLASYPELKLYVRTYGGYTSDSKLQANLEQLKKDVGEENLNMSHYFSAGYDPPWKFWGRTNEVWVMAK